MSQDQVEVGGKTYLRSTSTTHLAIDHDPPVPLQQAVARAGKMYELDPSNPDLLWVRFVLDAEGGNANWDYMSRIGLMVSANTARYKPFNLNHMVAEEASMVGSDARGVPATNTICGVMAGSMLTWANGNPVTDDELKDLEWDDNPARPDEERLGVVAWAVLWPLIFPQTTAELVDTIERGAMAVSMERWMTYIDYMVQDDQGKTFSISRAEAERNGVYNHWIQRRAMNGKPVYRRCLEFVYGGVAATDKPAQPLSRFLPYAQHPMEIALSEDNQKILGDLAETHDDLMQRIAVSNDGEIELLLEKRREILGLAPLARDKGGRHA